MAIPAQVYVTETLETEQCCNCGVWFAMPQEVRRKFLQEGGSFYCPNGHGQHYTKSEVQKLKDRIAEEQSRTQAALARENEERAEKERLARKLKRTERGVCPHCNRTFQNVLRHMACKHAAK